MKGDDVWTQIEGKPQIYLLRKYSVERIAVKPADFRDKTVVKAKEDDITSIEITTAGSTYALEHDGSLWKFGKGASGGLDDSKVKALATAFVDLKGGTFADATDPATTGLAKPASSVTLHLRDKSTVRINVGNNNKESTDAYVQRAGSPDVVMVKKFQVDRFTKKASELAKTEGPPAGH
jgi:hypothetical protein